MYKYTRKERTQRSETFSRTWSKSALLQMGSSRRLEQYTLSRSPLGKIIGARLGWFVPPEWQEKITTHIYPHTRHSKGWEQPGENTEKTPIDSGQLDPTQTFASPKGHLCGNFLLKNRSVSGLSCKKKTQGGSDLFCVGSKQHDSAFNKRLDCHTCSGVQQSRLLKQEHKEMSQMTSTVPQFVWGDSIPVTGHLLPSRTSPSCRTGTSGAWSDHTSGQPEFCSAWSEYFLSDLSTFAEKHLKSTWTTIPPQTRCNCTTKCASRLHLFFRYMSSLSQEQCVGFLSCSLFSVWSDLMHKYLFPFPSTCSPKKKGQLLATEICAAHAIVSTVVKDLKQFISNIMSTWPDLYWIGDNPVQIWWGWCNFPLCLGNGWLKLWFSVLSPVLCWCEPSPFTCPVSCVIFFPLPTKHFNSMQTWTAMPCECLRRFVVFCRCIYICLWADNFVWELLRIR